MDNQPQASKPTNQALWIVLVIIIVAAAGYGLYAYFAGNTNNNANTVANTNTANTNVATNTNGSNTNTATNTNVDMSGWKAYTNDKYRFTIQYPENLVSWEAELSPEVAEQRADGHLFDVGFRPENLQGSILVVRVFSKPLAEVTTDSQEHGALTDETMTLGGKTAIKMTENVRRYGIEDGNYSYIIENNNYKTESDLTIFDEMLQTFRINQ